LNNKGNDNISGLFTGQIAEIQQRLRSPTGWGLQNSIASPRGKLIRASFAKIACAINSS